MPIAEQTVQNDSQTNTQLNTNEQKTDHSFAIMLSLVCVLVLLLSVPIFIMKLNVFNAGETLRPFLNNTALKSLLPPANDPNNMELMDREQLLALIDEQKNKITSIENNLKDLKRISEIYTGDVDGIQKFSNDKAQLEKEKQQLQNNKAEFEKDRNVFFEQVKNQDAKAFQDYYEKMESETAKKLYEQVLRENRINEQIKEFVSYYEKMDSEYAAKVFGQMAGSQINLVANIISYMDKGKASKIMQAMDIKVAGKITDILAKKNPISK